MNRNNYFMPYSIVLTNEGLNYDGTENIMNTEEGFPIHKFPQQFTLPKFCKLKWVNLTINQIPSEKELYLCIKELPNKVFIGDGVNGRLQKGFLGLVNHLDTTSNVFSNFPFIYLRNTEPITLSQMTLEIYTNNGLASNFGSNKQYYAFDLGNNWVSSSGTNLEFIKTNVNNIFQIKNLDTNTIVFNIVFDENNPTRFITTSGLEGEYDIDITTPSPDRGKIVFTVGSTAKWSSSITPALVDLKTEIGKYALELRVEQENIDI